MSTQICNGEDDHICEDTTPAKHMESNPSRRTSHRVKRATNNMTDCPMKSMRLKRSSASSKHSKSNTKPIMEECDDIAKITKVSDSKTNKDVNIAATSYSKKLSREEVKMVDAATDYDLRSVGLLTEPENLGPCEPGTPVCLEGIVWQETSNGVLVVNVTWKGKSYMGTLIDSTKHDWSPPFRGDDDSGFSEGRTIKGRGKRIRVPLSEMFQDINERKLRKELRKAAAAKKNTLTSDKEMEVKSDEDCEPAAKKNKRSGSSRIIHCPNVRCSKKFKQLNGLKYHMKNFHQDTRIANKETGNTMTKEHSSTSNLEKTSSVSAGTKISVSTSTIVSDVGFISTASRASSVPLAAVPPQINLTKPDVVIPDQSIKLIYDNASPNKPSTLSESSVAVESNFEISEAKSVSTSRPEIQMLRMAPISTMSSQNWHNPFLKPIQPKPTVYGDSGSQLLSRHRQSMKNERQVSDVSIHNSHQQVRHHSQHNNRQLHHRPSKLSHSLLRQHNNDANVASEHMKPKERQLHIHLQHNSFSDIANDMISNMIKENEHLKSEQARLAEQNQQQTSASPFPSHRSDLRTDIPNPHSRSNSVRNGHTHTTGNKVYSKASHRNYSTPSTAQVPSQQCQNNMQSMNNSHSKETSRKQHKFDCNFNHMGTKPADKRLRELNSSMSQMISTSNNGSFPVDPKLYPSHMPESSLQSAMMMRVLNNLQDSMKRSSLPTYDDPPRK